MRWLVLVLVLVGCGYFKSVSESTPSETTQLDQLRVLTRDRVDEYLSISEPVTHWPDTQDCDGVVHAGMASAAGVVEVAIDLAETSPGKLGRRPSTSAPCWTKEGGDQGSKSETSADMALSYVTALWRRRDLGGIERLASYGEAHQVAILGLTAWILGEPYPGEAERVLLRPGLVGVVGRVLEALSEGADRRPYRNTPGIYSSAGEDYQKVLTVRAILLSGEVDRELTSGDAYPESEDRHDEVPIQLVAVDESMFTVLRELAEEAPDDPLFQAAYARYSGDYEGAYRALLNPELQCPAYTRGSRGNCLANWLYAASLLVGDVEGV